MTDYLGEWVSDWVSERVKEKLINRGALLLKKIWLKLGESLFRTPAGIPGWGPGPGSGRCSVYPSIVLLPASCPIGQELPAQRHTPFWIFLVVFRMVVSRICVWPQFYIFVLFTEETNVLGLWLERNSIQAELASAWPNL